MKKLIRLSTLLFSAIIISAGIANAATKASGGSYAIAIIDVNRILTESKAAKGLNDQMTTLRAKYEKEIYQKEETLRAQEAKLAGLKGDKLEKARKDLEASVAEFQKSIMMEQNKLQRAAQDAFEEIREKVMIISNDVAQEKGIFYVQQAATNLHFPADADITDATISRLDKELPSVKVQIAKS